MTLLKRHAVDLLGALVLLVFMAATALSGYELWVQRTLLDRVDRGATFSAVQLEREYVKLGEAVATYWAEPTEAQRERLRLRLDIFWSRFPILLEGPEGEAVRRFPGNLDRLTWGRDTLPALESAILALDRDDPESLADVRGLLDAYREPVTAVARNALQIDNYESTLERLLKAHLHSLYLYIAVMIAGLGLLFLLRRQVSRARAFAARAGEAEAALRRRVAAIEASLDGVALLDRDGRFTYLNAAHARIYGHDDPGALIGRPWADLYQPDEAERLRRQLDPALERTGRFRSEGTGRRADGSLFPQEIAISALDDGNIVCVVRDISERKAAEIERAKLREQRFRSQKLEAIGRLAGGIAHDFNNILAAIIGYAEFLVEDLPEGSESRAFAGNIKTAGDRAKRLVTQILTFSRQHDTRPAPTDLRDVVRETAVMLRATLPATVALELDLPEAPVPGHVDAGQIGQVLMNLCVNARDALPEGRGRISVHVAGDSTRDGADAPGPGADDGVAASAPGADGLRDKAAPWIEETEGGATLRTERIAAGRPMSRIVVTDTGCGMERATLEQLFDPFFTTKPVGQGTGLGLATVYGIVAAHGGALEVDSRPGQGTRFTVFLPAPAAPDARGDAGPGADAQPGPAERVATGLGGLPAGAPMRILVVDDEPMVRAMTARRLTQRGFVAETAADGEAALNRLADRGRPAVDLLVVDHAMPRMTGLDVARAAARIRPHLPIVLCTGDPGVLGPDVSKAGTKVGAVLAKPVEPEALAAAVRRLMVRTAPLRRIA